MPDVRLPDGTIVRNVPEGTTRSQLMARVGKAAPARNQGTGVGAIDQALSSVNEFLIGVPQGIYNAAATVTDPIAGMIFGGDAVKKAQGQRARAVDTVSRSTVSRPSPAARMTGQIAGTLNPAFAAIKAPAVLGRAAPVVTRALQGAIGGAATRGDNSSGAQEAGIGAAANVVLPPALARIAASRPVQATGRAIGRAATPIINAAGGVLDDASEAVLSRVNPALGLDYAPAASIPLIAPRAAAASQAPARIADLGKGADVRAARFANLGVKSPTTGMVSRDPRAWNFERETSKQAGVGDNLIRQFQGVESDLVKAGTDLVRKQGGAVGSEATGSAVQRALDAKRNEMQAATSGLYKQVREARGDAPAGPLNNIRAALDDPELQDNPIFDQMREGINRRLQRFGMAGESGMLRNDAVASIGQAEELRKMIGNLGSSTEPSVKYMRGRLIDALDDDVVDAVGDDAFKAARASAKERFGEFKKTFAGKVADEGIAPEKLTQRLFGATSLKDIRSLRKSLTSGTEDQVMRGTEALGNLRAQAVDDLLSPVVSADGKLNGTALFNKFNKGSDKYRALLDPEDYKKLRRIAQASRDATAEVPFSAVNNSNTASAAANLFARLPEKSRSGIMGLLAKHAGAFTLGGPAGNVAVMVGDEALKRRAGQQAADALSRQVGMAQSPQAAADAMRAAGQQGVRQESLAELIQRIQNGLGNNPALGGVAASAVPQQ